MTANLAAPAAVAGTLDTAVFLARRPALFRESQGRALGSAGFGLLWCALAVRSAMEGERATAPTAGLAATLVVANAAMLAVHLRHGITSPRVYAGAALSAVALADTLRRL